MRFVPFRFSSYSFSKLSPIFFIYDFSVKFNIYRFCDLPSFEDLFVSTSLPEQPSKHACFTIFSELLFYQFQRKNGLGIQSQRRNQIFVIKQLNFSSFISYLRFMFFYPDTRNLVSRPFSGDFMSFNFRIKDFSTLYNFFDYRLGYAHFYPTFYFFAKSSALGSQEIQSYMVSFFSAYTYKTNTLFS